MGRRRRCGDRRGAEGRGDLQELLLQSAGSVRHPRVGGRDAAGQSAEGPCAPRPVPQGHLFENSRVEGRFPKPSPVAESFEPLKMTGHLCTAVRTGWLIRKRTQESEGRWKCQTHTRQLKSRPLERFASSNVPSVNRAPVRLASASKLVASATRMSSRSRDYSPTLNFLAFPGTKRSDVLTPSERG